MLDQKPRKTLAVHPLLILAIALCFSAAAEASNAGTNGMFAVFQTSMGSFTCRLDFAEAPITTANFVGLAEGSRAWLDLPTGRVREDAYFDNQIFHRVVSNFVIQGGSPAGNGRDGPGYTIRDEFSTNLTHSVTGTLSMANSGFNSGGSQFFVTLLPTPKLDFDKAPLTSAHAVFGYVESGIDVVQEIGKVVVDAGDQPLTNVVIQSVRIERCGAEAQAFDVHAQGLPVVEGTHTMLQLSPGGDPELMLTRLPFREYLLYYGSDLTRTWTNTPLDYLEGDTNSTPVAVTPLTGSGPGFFHVPVINYMGPSYGLPSVTNYQFQLDIQTSDQTMFLDFQSDGTGTFILDEGATNEFSGVITGSIWSAPQYVIASFNSLSITRFRFDFSPNPTNTFSATIYPWYPNLTGGFQLDGVFTQPPPP